jgi:NADH-quinone oxidoreductase subunit C
MSQEVLLDLGEHIQEKHENTVTSVAMERGELVIGANCSGLPELLQFLKDDSECHFKMLVDITAIDYPSRRQRFEVVYNLLSLRQNQRVRIKVPVAEGDIVPSVTTVFKSAGWYEREVFDLYGILFEGNPDLRRILTDYGFEGHPLRKDFPLTGYVEVIYDPETQSVVYEPVSLTQDYRKFDFESPWEGMTDVQLPGDEKAVKPTHGNIIRDASSAVREAE